MYISHYLHMIRRTRQKIYLAAPQASEDQLWVSKPFEDQKPSERKKP